MAYPESQTESLGLFWKSESCFWHSRCSEAFRIEDMPFVMPIVSDLYVKEEVEWQREVITL